MCEKRPVILLTNDDGIKSPGIWAAADSLASLGDLWVVAPREQATSSGRSNPITSDGIIEEYETEQFEKNWKGYAVGASPAQCVIYALHEILPVKPDLIVSGINYGANTGVDITRSGTIGAALEAANYGVKAIAISLETDAKSTFSHSREADFSTAAYFTTLFAKAALEVVFAEDVHALKIEVPASATPSTPWEITRLAPVSLYIAAFDQRTTWREKGTLHWELQPDYSIFPVGSDSHTVFVKRQVAVTPLSMDLTSRVNLNELGAYLKKFL